jgi:LmbE family N-acetylglucosaminyl deacetylase
MTFYEDPPLYDLPVPRSVLIILAHPDDAEFFAGGTLAKWAQAGADLSLYLLTSGDKGSGDLSQTPSGDLPRRREEETCQAAQVLGIREVIFQRWGDGEIMPDLALRRAIVRMIRLKQPEAVLSSDPQYRWRDASRINHPDHWSVAEAVQAAVYPAARDHLNFPELYFDEGLAPHKVRWLYLSLPLNPNYGVETTATRPQQIAALKCHASQIGDPAEFEARMAMRYDRSLSRDPHHKRYREWFRVIELG